MSVGQAATSRVTMGPVPLARFFEPIVLTSEEWTDALVFGIGPADQARVERVKEWALAQAEENCEDYSDNDGDYVIDKVDVKVGDFYNDRYQSEGYGYAWCVGDDPETDWRVDEENFLELCKIAEKDADGCAYCGETGPCSTTFPDGRCRDPEEMLDDWQERVNADPDRWPMAPLGPFPGVMVAARLKYVRKVKVDVLAATAGRPKETTPARSTRQIEEVEKR